jgi:nucleoside 2-deoxyribosyltransferase
MQSFSMKTEPISIYWAGGLFNYKELLGNLQLGTAVENISNGKYKVFFPQDCECGTSRDIQGIRNQDLLSVLQCDVILANFDGTELDSGTVVEFCFAKALDIPAVLLRTDFRKCGDSDELPWNLMCSGWQRTNTLWINSMEEYHNLLQTGVKQSNLAAVWADLLAEKIIKALDSVILQAPWLPFDQALDHYRKSIQSAGSGFEKMLPDCELEELLEKKHRHGIL